MQKFHHLMRRHETKSVNPRDIQQSLITQLGILQLMQVCGKFPDTPQKEFIPDLKNRLKSFSTTGRLDWFAVVISRNLVAHAIQASA